MMMISDKMRKSNGLTFVRLPTRHTLDKQIEQTSTMMTMMKMMMMMMKMMMLMKMVMMISTMRMMEICQMGLEHELWGVHTQSPSVLHSP